MLPRNDAKWDLNLLEVEKIEDTKEDITSHEWVRFFRDLYKCIICPEFAPNHASLRAD